MRTVLRALACSLIFATLALGSVGKATQAWSNTYPMGRQYCSGTAGSCGVYVATNGSAFFGMDVNSGKQLWTVTPSKVDGSIIAGGIDGGRLVIGTLDYGKGVVAVNSTSGKVQWLHNDRNDFGIHVGTFQGFVNQTGHTNFAYVDGYNRVMVRAGSDGSVIWHSAEHLTKNFAFYTIGHPADPVVVLPAPQHGGDMCGYNASNGAKVWARNLTYDEAPLRASTTAAVVYGWDRKVAAASIHTGDSLWERNLYWTANFGTTEFFTPLVHGDAVSNELFLKYVSNYTGDLKFERLHHLTGEAKWSQTLNASAGYIESVVESGGEIYVVQTTQSPPPSRNEGSVTVTVFALADGKRLGSANLGALSTSAATFAARAGIDSCLFVSQNPTSVFAVNASAVVTWTVTSKNDRQFIPRSIYMVNATRVILEEAFFHLRVGGYDLPK